MQNTIVLGLGCFWCGDAVFSRVKGVVKVESGYSGGALENPTYNDVSTGSSGHVEVVKITFDSSIITLGDILNIFWKIHDPTSLNKQGADVGTQYKSVIFYDTEEQHKIALESKNNAQNNYDKPIVTEILPLKIFYKAEGYHQDFYNKNKNYPYCKIVIDPKIKKIFG